MTESASVQLVCPICSAINRVPGQKLGDRPLCGKCRKPLIDGQPINATDQNFSRFTRNNDLPLVVDFWAPWCGPCQQFGPIFSQIAAQMATAATFIKLDIQSNPATAGSYQIRSIPTLMLFHQGQEVTRMVGALPLPKFQQWLNQQLASLGR